MMFRYLPGFLAILLVPRAILPGDMLRYELFAEELVSSALVVENSGPKAKPKKQVYFIVTQDCPRCEQELARLRQPGGEFDAMKKCGWRMEKDQNPHLQIIDRDAVPELIEKLKVVEFPSVICVEGDEVVRYFKHGCTTPLDQWTFWWLFSGKDERPKSFPSLAAYVATTGSYRLRGNHWSVDGDWNPSRATVVSHLRGPVHASQLASHGRIEDWSLEELRSLHDDLHEREMGGVSAGSGSSFQASTPQSTFMQNKLGFSGR